jgi:hypothetical protein
VTTNMPALEDPTLSKLWPRAPQRGLAALLMVLGRVEWACGEADEWGESMWQGAEGDSAIDGFPAEVFLGSCPDDLLSLPELSAIEGLRENELSYPAAASPGNMCDAHGVVAR